MVIFREVTFGYDGAPEPLFVRLNAHFPAGWTGVVGANGAGKTTLLRLAAGELAPVQGQVQRAPGLVVSCPQRTDDPPPDLADLLAAVDAEACRLRGILGIGGDWPARWPTLSHGERKRAQIALALWRRPQVLLLDEPTNHIDLDARRMLGQALQGFRGVGLLVSHDRALLDGLCMQCLFLAPPQAVMRPGGYRAGAAQARREAARAQEEWRLAKDNLQRLQREQARRKGIALGSDRRRSKRHLARGDSAGRAEIDAARISGDDGDAGRLMSQMDGRVRKAREALAGVQIRKEYRPNFWLPGSVSPRPVLFTLPAGSLPLGEGRRLCFPELTMRRDDRVALTGANGAGKTTLVRHLLETLTLPPGKVLYLPQEIPAEQGRAVMAEVNALPPEPLGHVMTAVSGLGSRPERLVGSREASPGEIRKVLLALGAGRLPYLIVMDEPTNHLDLPAIELLEQALEDCPCGLLLVSHDVRFLARLARERWHLEATAPGTVELRVTRMEG